MFSCLQEASEIYSVAELRILSNWGHLEYTCVYRFRVHGEPSFVWEEDHLKGFFSFGLFYATTENVTLEEWLRQLPNVRIPKNPQTHTNVWLVSEWRLFALVLHFSNIAFRLQIGHFLWKGTFFSCLYSFKWTFVFYFVCMEDRLILCVTVKTWFIKPKVSCLARITIKQHLCCIALPFIFVLSSVCVLKR